LSFQARSIAATRGGGGASRSAFRRARARKMLGGAMRFRYFGGVAGPHGKTTTHEPRGELRWRRRPDPPSSSRAGRFCWLKSADSNARLGAGVTWVRRRPMKRRCIIHSTLQPMIRPSSPNIDKRPPRHQTAEFARLKQSVVDFLHNLPFSGLAVLCPTTKHVQSILERLGGPFLTMAQSATGGGHSCGHVVRDGLQST